MTNAEAVSKIKSLLKFTTKDTRVSNRFILSVLRSTAKTYISQRLMDRTIAYDYNLYTSLECIEFVKQSIVDCPIVEFRRCGILMKSKKPLPELVYSRLGASLKNITTVDSEKQFVVIDSNQYRRNKNRKYKVKDEVSLYLGIDNHLYIPDEEIYSLSAEFITIETDNTDCDCKGKDDCKSGWEYEFICPDKLEDPVFDKATQIIASTYGSIIQDSNPNGVERQETK